MAQIEQISYNSPDGAQLGQSATEKIGLWGATPVVQASAITTVVSGTAATVTATYAIGAADMILVIAAVNALIVANRNAGILALT